MSTKGRSELLKLKKETFNKLSAKMFTLPRQQDTGSGHLVMLQ